MRVLIISPHFPPTNAADMQRVRLLLPYFYEVGVEVEVLAVEPAQVAAPKDPWLDAGLPDWVPVHRVQALGLAWTKVPGLGTLSFRALGAIRRKGEEVLGRKVEMGKRKEESKNHKAGFDLVYFSTTQFGIHVLGPEWKRKFGVPFVMDYQDPWVNDYYRDHPDVVPPGGKLKYGLASWLSRRQEPKVLRECAGITSVSAAYPEQLRRRYGGEEIGNRKAESRNGEKEEAGRDCAQFQLSTFRFPLWSPNSQLFSTVLPFPGDARDLERVKQDYIRQSVFDRNDGLKHWVYVGRGGEDMAFAVRAIFAAVSRLRFQPSVLKLHFIGTSYAAAGAGMKTIEPLAAEYGLEDMVEEHPARIPYSETLRCLLDADALIVPGSDDPAYTASKIYPYLLAGKPILAVFHEDSSVVSLIRKVGGAQVVTFGEGETIELVGKRILELGMESAGDLVRVPLDIEAFEPFTARSQARNLTEFFQLCSG